MEGRERKRPKTGRLNNQDANWISLPKSPALLYSHYVLCVTGYASRFTSHALSITFLACFSLASVCSLAAQDNLPPAAGGVDTATDVKNQSEPSPDIQDTSLEKEKKRKSQLDPDNTTPEEGKVIGDGDEIFVQENIVQIHGNGLIKFEDVVLHADHIWADFDENIMRAAGNVRLIVENEETHANELVYNLDNKKGVVREGFTYSDPWYYRGTEIFKVEADESYIRGGSLTTCSLKHPHFYFSASKIIVKINKELIAKNIVLKVGGIPLFYFPVYRRDLRKDKVAKVIVKLGTDSYQGPFVSIILPLARRHRYDGALLFDQSARRGGGRGFEGKYRVNDVKFQEILVPIPDDATPTERANLEEKAEELSDRLEGKYDNFKMRQIFLEYKISEDDVARAHEEANEIYTQLQAEDGDFAEIAESSSDHQDTRYQGGNMGFLVHGERDEDGELRLNPVLENAAFQLQPGDISPILQTETGFHILKVEHAIEVYGEREIQVRRIDIVVEPSDETRESIQATADEIQERASAGEAFDQLASEYEEAEVSRVNQGEWMPLIEMDNRWRYSVRQFEHPGEITPPVKTNLGVYIFQLIEKQPTPSFEEIASQFEAEWAALQAEKELIETREDPEEQDGAEPEENGEPQSDSTHDAVKNTESDNTIDSTEEEYLDEENGEEEAKVYEKYGFRGKWEMPRNVASQTQRLYRGESSRVIKTKKGYRIVEVDRKRTFRGDLLFLAEDQYSSNRKKPFRTGQKWTMRWGHNHVIYTPWDSRAKGRRPVSWVSRVLWGARTYKEGLGENESTIDSFSVVTWGSALSARDTDDYDEDGNLTFSRETIGEFLGRLQVNHTLDLTGEGTTTLQKLPAFTVSLSRMRFNRLPLFKSLNSGLTWVADKLRTDRPILSMVSFPTLENTSFDFDTALGNFYRERYRDEEDVFLQTMDLGFDLRKQSTSQIMPNRELLLDVTLQSNLIWHSKDRAGNQNILRGVYSTRATASNTLFRIYDIGFIPGVRRMRHQIDSSLKLNYQPPVEREEDDLYPFGPSTHFFERKSLAYVFRTSIEVKTRRSKSALRLMDFTTRLRADFSERAKERNREFDLIESDLRITPLASRKMTITMRTTHNPNESEIGGERFKMVGFRTNLRYRRTTWHFSLGSSFNKRTTRARRDYTASWSYRPNRLVEFDFNLIYDWIEQQFYSQSIAVRRNLHDWNLTIRWNRRGIRRGTDSDNVRQDFIFQINLIEESAASVGLGYDATTDTWGFRSLPAGVPYNAFSAGTTLGRSYF